MTAPKGGYAPNLEKFLDSLKGRHVETSVELLVSLLKRRQIRGSENCATATAHILLQVVARDKWMDVDQLLGRIQLIGKKLVAAQPHELVIGNIIRRVLGLIRDEASEDRNDHPNESSPETGESTPSPTPPAAIESSSPPMRSVRPAALAALGSFIRTKSMLNFLSSPDSEFLLRSNLSSPALGSGTSTPVQLSQSTNLYAFRSEVIDGIEEILDEIRQVDEQIQAYSDIFVHPGDYILVHQPSRTVQKFLTRAASKRSFTVFLVVDPSTNSDVGELYTSFRKSMATSGSTVVSVMNVGLTAYMSKVNKVILGARAIIGDGAVLGDAGAEIIARAARAQGRTVIVLSGVYKLSPQSRSYEDMLIEWGNPSRYVKFSDGVFVSQVRVKNAISELIPAEYVDTYITNLGAHTQEQLHTIIADHYQEEDITFDLYRK